MERVQNAWNAFLSRSPTTSYEYAFSYGYRGDRIRLSHGNERSIVGGIYNRIALDCTMIDMHHVRCDEDGQLPGKGMELQQVDHRWALAGDALYLRPLLCQPHH